MNTIKHQCAALAVLLFIACSSGQQAPEVYEAQQPYEAQKAEETEPAVPPADSLFDAYTSLLNAHTSLANDYKKLQQQLTKERTTRSKAVAAIIINSLALVAVFALIVAYVVIHRKRAKREQHTVAQALPKPEETAQQTAPPPLGLPAPWHKAPAATAPTAGQRPAPSAPAPNLIHLFHTIDQTIREERLYTDQNLQRQDIISRFGITRVTLNQALKQGVGEASFPAYINTIRMEQARLLLSQSPQLSAVDIAEQVGLTQNHFHRLFKQTTGLSPMQYREQHLPLQA